MSKEKQILQLFQDGYSQRHIATLLQISRNTVARVVKAASEHSVSKAVLEITEEAGLHHMLFPEEVLIHSLVTPDFAYIHKKLLKRSISFNSYNKTRIGSWHKRDSLYKIMVI